jgi:integrase
MNRPYPKPFKCGNVTVKVYRNVIEGKPRWRVCFQEGGKPRFLTFSDPVQADVEARNIAERLNAGQVAAGSSPLSASDCAQYAVAAATVQPFACRVDGAIREWGEAKRLLGGRSLVEAARYYAQKFPKDLPNKSVAEVVAELLAKRREKAERGQLAQRYVRQMDYHLRPFVERFHCPLRSISRADLEQFLEEKEWAPKTVNNHIGTIKTFFGYARRQGYLEDNPAAGLELLRWEGRVEIWTKEELCRLLAATAVELKPSRDGISNHCRHEFLACMAIAAFAGLRSEEIQRLDWADIKLDDGRILVRDVARGERNKTGKRAAPLFPNLRSWLLDGPRCGLVWPYSRIQYYETQRALAEIAGLPWRRNALRHSFISYRIQAVGNGFTVARSRHQPGHDQETLLGGGTAQRPAHQSGSGRRMVRHHENGSGELAIEAGGLGLPRRQFLSR